MDKMTDRLHELTKEEMMNSFGPTSWQGLCNDIAVSFSFSGKQPSKKKVAECVIEIAEAEGMEERVPQEIRNWLTERNMTEDEKYYERLGM